MKRALFEDEHDWFRESVTAFVDHELMPKREREDPGGTNEIMKEVIGRSLGLEEPRG